MEMKPPTSAILALALCALTLSGCSRQSIEVGPTGPEIAADPAAGDYGWHYLHNAQEGAKLAYGAPASDNVLLMMTCDPGSGRLALSKVTAEAHDGIELASNGARNRFAATAQPSEMGGMVVEAQAAASAAPLAGFARTGDLTMIEDGAAPVSLTAGPTSQPHVRKFFESCRA